MRAWEKFIQEQEAEIGVESARRWLSSLKVKSFDAGNLYLEAKDAFQVLWFEEHIRSKLPEALITSQHKPIKVHLEVASDAEAATKKKPKPKGKPNAPLAVAGPKFALTLDALDPQCTFENFYSPESNLLPYKILSEVAGYRTERDGLAHPQSQLAVFNPIYIYGRTGTGKTHLLMATAQALRQRGLNAVYVRAETFTEHVVLAIRAAEMSTFRRTYRDSDVLIVDDVNVFSRKGATQEELFHTFNTLHVAGKQIILSASCSPQELQLIEPRLVSRFEWGIVMPLEPLKQSELSQVVRRKAASVGFSLPPRIEELLCESFSSSPKPLCQALEALILRLHMRDKGRGAPQLTVELAKDLLKDLMTEEAQHVVRPDHVLQKVAEAYGIRVDDLTGRGQTRDTVMPRQLAMYLCRQSLKMPLTAIGELFGRDHSTVISSIRQVQKRLDDPEAPLAAEHSAILNKLQS